MNKTPGILLVNTGSPDSPGVADVRRYLNQFLMDDRVLDAPAPLRRLIVSGFILPFRPKRSAEAYRSIWWEDGSPLVVLSRRLQQAVQAQLDMPVALAMRYQHPSLDEGLAELLRAGVSDILLVPLFPQYAMSTVLSAVEETERALARSRSSAALHVLPPFYHDARFIAALIDNARPSLAQGFDHLLFSYHGLPERHLRKTDPTHAHCLRVTDCCTVDSPAHSTCYRHQVLATTDLFVQQADIPADRYSVSFQSRLGQDAWLQPATASELPRLARAGVRRIAVISPAFVTDCLETLEEIAEGGRNLFLEAGGQSFTMIPALNTHPAWVSTLSQLCREAAARIA
ncbi:MAG: ferrochelatase [Anaerolineae bacterium]